MFFRTIGQASSAEAHCPDCGGSNLSKVMSRVAVMKSDDRRIDDLADPALMAGLEREDPQALAGFMRKMSDDAGEPLDDEMTEMIERLEAGQSIDAIETTLSDDDADQSELQRGEAATRYQTESGAQQHDRGDD